MKNSVKPLLILFLGVITLFLSCKKNSNDEASTPSEERIIINNSASLNNRVRYTDSIVTLQPDSGRRINAVNALNLVLKAEIAPPLYKGTKLRATHVYIINDMAYVSYNLEGEPYLGGVEVIDVHNKNKPTLVSQAIFLNTDVSALTYDAGKLYLAEATGDAGFSFPAVLEEITLSGGLLTSSSRRLGLTSYAATWVEVTGGKVLVTSGSTGGLTVVNQGTLTKAKEVSLADARAVESNSSKYVVMTGTPGKLRVYNKSDDSFIREVNVGGAGIPESKSGIAVTESKIYAGVGDGGMSVVDINTGNILANQPRPAVTGIPLNNTVTNTVTVDGDYIYTANGEAGVYVSTMTGNTINQLGYMKFTDNPSANFVFADKNLIFIATGNGGLKIVQVIP